MVAIGNAAGFVEPLEATALMNICQQARFLALALADAEGDPQPTARECLNSVLAFLWDEIRDFLAVHYKFNTRLDTPFWQHCRRATPLHGADRIVRSYQENGPTNVFAMELANPTKSNFHLEGFYALLLGQKVPHRRLATPDLLPGDPDETPGRVRQCRRRRPRPAPRARAIAPTGLEVAAGIVSRTMSGLAVDGWTMSLRPRYL